MVVNPENPVTCLTVDQLAEIWGRTRRSTSWGESTDLDADVRRGEWSCYGPGTDSGTFDYFTDAMNGEEGVQTKDYNNVGEDDNATVTGVAGDPAASATSATRSSGEQEHAEGARDRRRRRLRRSVGETVQDGSYAPLGRPLYMYPSQTALERDECVAFIEYYLDNVNERCRRSRVHPAHGRAAERVRGRGRALAG